MKVAIVSVHPDCHTGYGVQSDIFASMFVEAGLEVCIYSIYGSQEHIDTKTYQNENGEDVKVKIYPANQKDVWTNLQFMTEVEKPDLYWGILDGFILPPELVSKYNWAHMYMADTQPLHPNNLIALQQVNHVIGLTEWSCEALQAASGRSTTRIPLLVDEDAYGPIEGAREWFNRTYNVDADSRVFSFVGANVGVDGDERKNIPLLLEWWSCHSEVYPEDILYLHTDYRGVLGGKRGFDLERIINLTGCRETTIRFANPINYAFGKFSSEYMSRIYSASDAMIVPSYSEGFGLPYVEAACCGCPPVGLDFGAGGEVISNCGGVVVNCVPKIFSGCSYKADTTVEDIEDAIEQTSGVDRNLIAENAIQYTVGYNKQRIISYLEEIINGN